MRLLMKIAFQGVVISLTILIGAFVCLSFQHNSASHRLMLEVRAGTFSDIVLLPKNVSSQSQTIRVYIYEGEFWKCTEAFELSNQEEKAIGYFEFAKEWKPKAGNKGFIDVEGCSTRLYFELADWGIQYKEIHGLPSDFPGQLVRDK